MGCSPSRGQLFTGIYNHQDKTLQFGSYENNNHHFSGEAEIKSLTETEIVSGGVNVLQEQNTAVQGKASTVCDVVKGWVDKAETDVQSQVELQTTEDTDRKDERRMKNHGFKRRRHKARPRKSVMQSHVGFPQATVKAQQAAYAYLENNIPKYESLLELLEKVAQTKLSLQSMVTLLSLQYEEINQILNEIAAEGEQMLEMHGNHMVLPASQNDVALTSDIPEAQMISTQSSPDLLQHMLHHSIQKMRLVGDSVKVQGDASLEETGDYFGSMSRLPAGKLDAKRASELRLKQILTCVESYTLRKIHSESTALHSENNGTAVKNEFHGGSSGSGSSSQSLHGCHESSLSDQSSDDDDDDDADRDIDAEDSNDDEETKHEQRRRTGSTNRKMSNLSLADPSQDPVQIDVQIKRRINNISEWRDQKKRNIKWHKTAEDLFVACQRKHRQSHLLDAQRSRSADCLWGKVNDYKVRGQNRFPDDNQKPEWIIKGQHPSQFSWLQDSNIGSLMPGLPPSINPSVSPLPPGKNAVRRLINTFSKGVCDSSNQKPLKNPPRFEGRKNNFLLMINNSRLDVSTNGNTTAISCPPEKQMSENPDVVDMNSLPPPPPELLMDSSFKKIEGLTGDGYSGENQSCSTQRHECCVSQCPQPSMQIISLRPRQDSLSEASMNSSETYLIGQDFLNECYPEHDSDQPTGHGEKEKEKAIGLLKHTQSAIHLSHSTDILAKLDSGDEGNVKSLSETVGGTPRLGNRDLGEGEASNLYISNHFPTPPVSRARFMPSTRSACHKIPRSIACPPAATCSVNFQRESLFVPSTGSQIQRSSRRDSDDENAFMSASSSISFSNARSVFCKEDQLEFQSAKPSYISTLPRPWGEPKFSREKLQTTCLSQSFKRSSPCRSNLTDHHHFLPNIREPQYPDDEATTLQHGRKEYVATLAQCSKQEISASCSMSGPQWAGDKLTDEGD